MCSVDSSFFFRLLNDIHVIILQSLFIHQTENVTQKNIHLPMTHILHNRKKFGCNSIYNQHYIFIIQESNSTSQNDLHDVKKTFNLIREN